MNRASRVYRAGPLEAAKTWIDYWASQHMRL